MAGDDLYLADGRAPSAGMPDFYSSHRDNGVGGGH